MFMWNSVPPSLVSVTLLISVFTSGAVSVLDFSGCSCCCNFKLIGIRGEGVVRGSIPKDSFGPKGKLENGK